MLNVANFEQRFILACLLSGTIVASAQAQGPFTYNRTGAIEESQAQAARAAEETVSLSANKIIPLLERETGLLLEVKKLLVRKAFEQGRILDARDLTDEALFRLIRDDETIRILVTGEIERRYYVRAMPTREERERDRWRAAAVGIATNTNDGGDQGQQPGASREDRYWQQRARVEIARPPVQPAAAPTQTPQPSSPSQDQDQQLHSLLRSQMRGPDTDNLNGVGTDNLQLQQVRPEDLPALLRTSSGAGMTGGGASLGGWNASSSEDSEGSSGSLIKSMAASSSFGATGGLGMSAGPLGSAGILQGLSPLQDYQQDLNPAQSQRAGLDSRDHLKPPFSAPTPSRPDHAALARRANPYADVPSLYDLYSQYGRRSPQLVRFGQDIFANGTGNFDELPMDMPVGPDYVLGPGDGLNVELWGSVSQRLRRVVDRAGRIALPEVGFIEVSGKSLGDVQRTVQSTLRQQFRDVQADISLSRLRTVRVYVVGDGARPGAYDVSSLSTPLNAVFSAGGPTARGSLRVLRHYRGQTLVQEVDVYDLLLHGVRTSLEHMQAGDTVLVPTLGAEVTVEGMVRRPSIYELHGEKNLAEVLELAGGVLPSGTLRHVDVERVEAHESRTMLRLDIPESNNQEAAAKALEDFVVHDGDKVKISPILPYADKTVFLDGHVFRPGKYAYRDGMKITDLIGSYNDMLPEPSKQHAEIVRLAPPDYAPQVVAFNLEDALSGKLQDVALKPFDTVRIFSRFDFEDPPVISINGEVRDPGDHVTNGVTRVRDAVYLAGGLTPNAQVDTVQILRRSGDNQLHILSVNLARAIAGEDKENILLEPKDRLIVHRNFAKVDPPTVQIEGEVGHPGKYALGQEMTAAELVRVAGGFKRGAYTETADLTRYAVEHGQSMVGEHSSIPIGRALAGEPDTDVRLRDGDVLTIKELAGWRDVGASITVTGEVLHPGTYGIQDGERLSSIIERAGGLRSSAYPYGAVFERAQVREIAERKHEELLRRVEEEGAGLKAIPDGDSDQQAAKRAALMQWQSTLEHLQNTPPAGRLVIHISKDRKRWVNTSADIQVRAGDTLYIPKTPNSVMVDGAVYNSAAVSYKPGKDAGWYLRQAGGPTSVGNKRGVFVIRADGSVAGGSGGMFTGGVERAELRPGDMVVVPDRTFSANSRWKDTLQGAQLAYAVGVAIQVARSF
ncbi:MAG TPA: SLBB domain-containing protein [Terriglobales bacterium]|nr:SLBB domain-containing protein [Terriglobales bacterium]